MCTLLSVPHRNALKLLKVGFCGDSSTFKIVELSITNRIWRIWGLCQNKDQHLKIHGNKDIHRGNTFISYSLPEWKQTEGIKKLQGEEDPTEMMAHALGLLWELLLWSGASVRKNNPQIHRCSNSPPWLLKTGTLNTWVSSPALQLRTRSQVVSGPPTQLFMNLSFSVLKLDCTSTVLCRASLTSVAAMNFLVTWNVPLLEWGVPKVHNNTPTSKTVLKQHYILTTFVVHVHVRHNILQGERECHLLRLISFWPFKTSSLEASLELYSKLQVSLDYRGETLVSINKALPVTYKNSQDATTGTCPALWLSFPLWTAPSASISPPSLFSVVSPAHILGPLLLAVLPTWDAFTPDIYMVHSLCHILHIIKRELDTCSSQTWKRVHKSTLGLWGHLTKFASALNLLPLIIRNKLVRHLH